MKMKKVATTLLAFLLTLGMGICTACDLPFGDDTPTSSESSSSIEDSSSNNDASSSEESSSTESESSSEEESSSTESESSSEEESSSTESESSSEEESSSEDSSEDSSSDASSSDDESSDGSDDPDPIDPAEDPKAPEKKDLATLDMITSYQPEGCGVKATLTEDEQGVRDVIKGSFNNKGATTYPGEDGGAWVWTYLSIYLPTVNDGVNGDLRNKALQFTLKTANCSPVSSIILIDENGQPSEEVSFQNTGLVSDAKVETLELFNGWYEFTINLPLIFDADVLDNVSEVIIVFSNAYGNNAVDSVFYIDEVYFTNPRRAWPNPTVYNHEGYYDKDEELFVMFAGNSFIEFSASASWFNEICYYNGANGYADYNWTPGGRIPDQYKNAFADGGYMLESDKPNVLFIQDFYAIDDALDLGEFLEKALEVSPFTEVIVYAADNETDDGALAANRYGLDFVNWRGAIHTLKSEHGFTTANLNYNDGAMHANELNGVFGAAMAYMQLYGEIPDMDSLWESIVYTMGREGDDVVNFLPGETEEEKQAALAIGLKVCAELCGLDSNEICLHQYTYETLTDATCDSAGFANAVCELCQKEIETVTRPLGHLYENGECIRCDVDVLEEDGDFAHVNYTVPVPEEEVEAITAMLPMYATAISTQVSVDEGSALKTSFIDDGTESMLADEETPFGLFTTILILDISDNDVGISLNNKALRFDIKLENCTPMISLALLSETAETAGTIGYLMDGMSGMGGFAFVQDGDWYHCTLDLRQVDGISGNDFVGLMFNIYSDGLSDEATFWLDNILFEGDYTPDATVDLGDFASPDILTTEIIDNWIIHSDLVLQNDVVSEYSTSALRGSFNVANADAYYDSANDPNGDGGHWVWTAVTMDLTELAETPYVSLQNLAFVFDIKVENGDATSSLILLKADGTRAAQLAFNNDPENPDVSATEGYYKEILEDGWVRIVADFSTLYGEDANEVHSIYLLISNAYGDYIHDTVFYLDNMYFIELDADDDEDDGGDEITADYGDIATPDILTTEILDLWITHADLVLQTEVVSEYSTSALRGSFNVANADAYYDSTQDPNGDGGYWVWTAVKLDLVELYGETLDLRADILTFDIMVENGDATSSIILLKADGTRAAQLAFNNDPENPGASASEGFQKEILEDGWVRITVDFETLYGDDAEDVEAIYLIISNAYGDYVNDTVFYLDNMMLY